MALLRIPDEKQSLSEVGEVTRYLANMGIDYERWEPSASLPPTATAHGSAARVSPNAVSLRGWAACQAGSDVTVA